MSMEATEGYWVPECVRAYLRGAGYSTRALEDMEPHVREWDRWMRAVGEFYDYRDTDGFGRVYQVHRRSIMPAMRVCREWGFASSGREDRGGLREPGVNRLAGVALLIHELLGQGAGDRGAGVRAGDRCLCRVDGQSVFADAFDAVQSVDLAYDALINEVDAGKMRVFLSDVMFRPCLEEFPALGTLQQDITFVVAGYLELQGAVLHMPPNMVASHNCDHLFSLIVPNALLR